MYVPLSRWTTFGIGGAARGMTVAKTKSVLADEISNGALVLGYGSNVLVSDSGYDGDVVINRYADIEARGAMLIAGSGAALPKLSAVAAENGLTGLEWATGIPGSVGGAIKSNAGAFGKCMADVVIYADVMYGGEIKRLYRDELGFSYRKSALGEGTVLSAAFMLSYGNRQSVYALCELYRTARLKKQPVGKSAGSVFKNLPDRPIAPLIERAGFKGYRVGGAEVSNKHANVILNVDNARASDVAAIITAIKQRLAEDGIFAEEEIVYIGEF